MICRETGLRQSAALPALWVRLLCAPNSWLRPCGRGRTAPDSFAIRFCSHLQSLLLFAANIGLLSFRYTFYRMFFMESLCFSLYLRNGFVHCFHRPGATQACAPAASGQAVRPGWEQAPARCLACKYATINDRHYLGFRPVPFRVAKRHVSSCKTAHIALRNAPFRAPKRRVSQLIDSQAISKDSLCRCP